MRFGDALTGSMGGNAVVRGWCVMGRSYLQALAAAKKAMKQCEAAGEPCQRPADYYAEMMKSDTQMKKVPSLCD